MAHEFAARHAGHELAGRPAAFGQNAQTVVYIALRKRLFCVKC
jgi:hypothetical protein